MTHDSPRSTPDSFPRRGSYAEARRIGTLLRKEPVGGILLVAAAAIAIIWANPPAGHVYFAPRDFKIGYAPCALDLPLAAWAADGLPQVSLFLAGSAPNPDP